MKGDDADGKLHEEINLSSSFCHVYVNSAPDIFQVELIERPSLEKDVCPA